MDPISGGIAGKLLGLMAKLFGWATRKLSADWRAARAAKSRARSLGVNVHFKPLKRTLASGEVRLALKSGDPKAVEQARELLRAVPTRGPWPKGSDLLEIVRLAYVETGEVGAGLAEISQQVDSLSRTLSTPGGFSSHLTRLSPVLAADAKALHETHPQAIESAVSALVLSQDRRSLLRDWAHSPPAWVRNLAGPLGWLGEVAAECDVRDAAVAFFDMALDLGANPMGYWRLRRLFAKGSSAESTSDDIAYTAPVADYPLVAAVLQTNSSEQRDAAIMSFKPSSASQASLASTIRVHLLRDAGRLDDAIESGSQAWRSSSHAGAALAASEALVRRSVTQGSRKHAGDLSKALELALEVRMRRREWGSDSGAAVAMAMRCYMLLMDPERAWSLSQTEERGGEATEAEAQHPDVRNEAVVLMAERGSIDVALADIDDSYSSSARLQVQAREAELLLEQDRADDLWSRAIDAAEDWNEKASLCLRLAMHGKVHPFAEELASNGNEAVAEEIRLIADLFNGSQLAEHRVREAADENPRLAHALISFLSKGERHEDLVFVAERAAETWGDADDWLRAARAHFTLGRRDLAADRARHALQVGGSHWGDRFSALVVLLEIAFQESDWASATVHAQALITLRPQSAQAHWALVIARYQAGDDVEAFEFWQAAPGMLMPRSRIEALTWLNLFRKHGSQMAGIAEAVSVVREFSSDAQVRTTAAGALLLAPVENDPNGNQVGKLLEELERDYPDDHGFTKFTLTTEDPEAMLAELDELAGGPRDLGDAERGIALGTMPVGLVSMLTPRLFAEALVISSRRPRFVGRLNIDEEVGFVTDTLGKVPVLDATALLTLALLPDEAAMVAFRGFAGGTTVARQLLDANASRDSLARSTGGHFMPSRPDRSAQFVMEDPEEHDRQVALSAALVEWFRRTKRLAEPPQLPAHDIFETLSELYGTWSSALALAFSRQEAIWCDDAATRSLAVGLGLPTFGTAAVIETLRRSGTITAELATSIEASLILRYSVGVPFRSDSYALALTLDQFRPHGVAAALRFSGPTDFEAKLPLMLGAMGRVEDPQHASEWAQIAGDYMGELTKEPAGLSANRALLVQAVLGSRWMTPAVAPFVMSGLKKSFVDGWDSAFALGIEATYRKLVDAVGHEHASALMLGLVDGLDPEDRSVALAKILEV